MKTLIIALKNIKLTRKDKTGKNYKACQRNMNRGQGRQIDGETGGRVGSNKHAGRQAGKQADGQTGGQAIGR